MTALVALALVALPQSAAAAGAHGRPPPIAISREARGLDQVDGELWAVGAIYKARFERGGLLIVPPLGPDAPRSLPLWLAFESADIGGVGFVVGDGAAEAEQGELAVRYLHGPALTERYEVGNVGLEQSFVFTELPAARGELVVRLRIATELVPRVDGAGLFFEGAPGRGLRVSGLTAVDARGRRAPGRVRLAGDLLELVVSADFLDSAVLPLVLESVYGGPIDVFLGPGEVGDPDITGTLVVFERRWAADDIDVYGQLLDLTAGVPEGPLLLLETSLAALAMNPSVAVGSAGVNGAFLVVWQQGPAASGPFDVVGRAFYPSPTGDPSAWMTAAFAIASTAATEVDPDVSALGTSSVACTEAARFLVAFSRSGIRLRMVDVGLSCPGHFIAQGSELALSTIGADGRPATERLPEFAEVLVVWERFFPTPSPGQHDLFCSSVRSLSPSSFAFVLPVSSVQLTNTIVPDEVEADPQLFTTDLPGGEAQVGIAFERSASSTSADDDVHVLRLTLDQTTFETIATLGPTEPIAVGAGDDDGPAISRGAPFNGEPVWVAWLDHGSLGTGTLHAVGRVNDGATSTFLQPCEPEFELAGSAAGLGFQDLELADNVAVFESIGFGVYAQELAPLLHVFDVLDASGPTGECVPDGTSPPVATRTCPCVVGAHFTHKLSSAPPNQPAFLIMNSETAYIGCGQCAFVPDPFTGFVFAAGLTNSEGAALLAMPIPDDPALVGLEFYDQWAIADPVPPCPVVGVRLSGFALFQVQAH